MAKKTSTKNKDILKGTNAADVLTIKHSQVTVNAGKGNDKINVNSGSSHKIYGEAGEEGIPRQRGDDSQDALRNGNAAGRKEQAGRTDVGSFKNDR